jgi:hypothetical protein
MKKLTKRPWTACVLSVASVALLLVSGKALAADSVPTQVSGENLATTESQTIAIAPEKTYALVFLSTKCPCSLSHLTELKNLAHDYPDVQMIGVHSNLDEDVKGAETYFKVHALGFPVIQDRDNALANELGAFKTPHVFVIRSGKVLYRGGVSDHQTYAPDARKYLREALEDLKQNRPVKNAATRTLGCAIPRS